MKKRHNVIKWNNWVLFIVAIIIIVPVVIFVVNHNNNNFRKNHSGIDFKKNAFSKGFDTDNSEDKAIRPYINYTSYSNPFVVQMYKDSIKELDFTDYISMNQIDLLNQFEKTGILIKQVDPDRYKWIKNSISQIKSKKEAVFYDSSKDQKTIVHYFHQFGLNQNQIDIKIIFN